MKREGDIYISIWLYNITLQNPKSEIPGTLPSPNFRFFLTFGHQKYYFSNKKKYKFNYWKKQTFMHLKLHITTINK